jgi:hypothetical protein
LRLKEPGFRAVARAKKGVATTSAFQRGEVTEGFFQSEASGAGDYLGFCSGRSPKKRWLAASAARQAEFVADLRSIFLALALDLLDAVGIGGERIHGFRRVGRGRMRSAQQPPSAASPYVHGFNPFIGWIVIFPMHCSEITC